MALKLDLLDRENRLAAVPVVLERHPVDDRFAVELDPDLVADHLHVEAVPVADLFVGDLERLGDVARLLVAVVVKAARTDMPLVVGIPDLHLRSAAQIKPAVAGDRHDAPVGPELEIAVVTDRGERIAACEAVEEEVSVTDGPVLLLALVGYLLHFGALFGARRLTDDGVVELLLGRHALPHRLKLLLTAVEVGLEPARGLHRLIGACAHLRAVGQLLDADVFPLHVVAVAEPADMAALVVKAGMLALVGRVAVTLELRDIALRDEITVEVVFDFAADDFDFGEVPHSGPAHIAAAAGEILLLPADLLVRVVAERGNDAVDGAGILVGRKLVLAGLLVVIEATAVVKELKLAHSMIGRIHIGRRRTDAETVVAVFGHHEFEAEDEVAVLLSRDEIAGLPLHLTVGEALKDAGLLGIDAVHAGRSRPTLEIDAVEKRDEALVYRLRVCLRTYRR